jgi:hypothetical protein
VHVRNVAFAPVVAALKHPRAFEALAVRSGDATAAVHDLTAGDVLRMPLATWAALRHHRDAPAPAGCAPPAPAGVPSAQWAALLRGEHVLYLSALEMQTHAPEVAAAFNCLASAACLTRFLPASAGVDEHLGPILMAAEAGACSGWHRDGTRVRGAAFRAGDVNAFHALLAGAKTWRLYAPRHSDAVARALRHAQKNAFGNLDMPAAAALEAQGVRSVEIEARAGDVVITAKRVWHAVWTTQASLSLASDRLLPDQLPELAAALPSFDGKPLIPAKWAVCEAAASLSAAVLHGTAPPGELASMRATLRGAAAFLEAQVAAEVAVQAGSKVYAKQPPACVSCERPHSRLRYCHACGCELFNAFFVRAPEMANAACMRVLWCADASATSILPPQECRNEDCPWEACGACCTGRNRADPACAHASLESHLLHRSVDDIATLLRRVREAADARAAEPA